MKLPSVTVIVNQTLSSIRRFPLVFMIAVISAVFFCMNTEYNFEFVEEYKWLLRIALVCLIGISLTIGLYLSSEKWKIPGLLRNLGITAITAVFLWVYYNRFNLFDADIIIFAIIMIAFHIGVALTIPYKTINELEIWYFNKILIQRLLLSALFTMILYSGISLAMFAMDRLLGIYINYRLYGHLFAWLGLVFNTLFFLNGIPKGYDDISLKMIYPKVLKVLSQYVLIPLGSVYFVILVIYGISILIKWELPKGLVSSLIITYSAVGILSLLLVYPVKDEEGNRWLTLFSKWFYRLLPPLLLLMTIAIWQRVADYGITIDRYLLIVLNIWLYGIAFYYIFSNKKYLRIILISFFWLSLIISVGPWGVVSVSETSQMKRFIEYDTKHHPKKKVPGINMVKISAKDYSSMRSIINYLIYFHKSEKFNNWFKTKYNIKEDLWIGKQSAYDIINLLNINADDDISSYIDKTGYFHMENSDQQKIINVTGFDKMTIFNYSKWENKTLKSDGGDFMVILNPNGPFIKVFKKQENIDTLKFDLRKLTQMIIVKGTLSLEERTLEMENSSIKAKLFVTSMNGDSNRVSGFGANILIKLK